MVFSWKGLLYLAILAVISNQVALAGAQTLQSPLEQVRSWVAPQDVKCPQGLDLVINKFSEKSACIGPSHAARLLTIGLVTPQTFVPVHSIMQENKTAGLAALSFALFIGPEIHSAGSTSNQTDSENIANSGTVSIISIQPMDQAGDPVLAFAKGTNGFAKVYLSSQSNHTALTTVDLTRSDLTNLGIGSVRDILNQTNEISFSFFIPVTTADGTANVCADVYSDWPDKGGFPLTTESCTTVQIVDSTLKHNNVTAILPTNKSIVLHEAISTAESVESSNDFGCVSSPSNKTEDVHLGRDNYLQQTVTLTSGQKFFPLLVQKVCPNYVAGKQYFSHPVCCPSESVTLHVGDSVGGFCDPPSLTLLGIQGGRAIFSMGPGGGGGHECPICLSGNTMIDTPNGAVNVKELKMGMSVWTSDNLGHRELATILKTGKTLVPTTHKMVHVVLDDGRELYASQGHPTADGRFLEELSIGDVLDNSRVKSIDLALYNENYTYDILPSGSTGFYWANGILVGSTLK